MKINKNKGKVHPSPSSVPSSDSSSSSSNSNGDALSVLHKVLPAAILALTVVLSLGDREVLAYMITRSMKTANPSSIGEDSKKKKKKKRKDRGEEDGKKPSHANHEALFDCDCFDCYTSFWFRWDSSPNRELIHQAIEAFEDHLSNGERSSKRNGKGKKKDRQARRPEDRSSDDKSSQPETDSPAAAVESRVPSPAISAAEAASSPVKNGGQTEEAWEGCAPESAAAKLQSTAENDPNGPARKEFPDVLGLLNSRLWSLWSPKA